MVMQPTTGAASPPHHWGCVEQEMLSRPHPTAHRIPAAALPVIPHNCRSKQSIATIMDPHLTWQFMQLTWTKHHHLHIQVSYHPRTGAWPTEPVWKNCPCRLLLHWLALDFRVPLSSQVSSHFLHSPHHCRHHLQCCVRPFPHPHHQPLLEALGISARVIILRKATGEKNATLWMIDNLSFPKSGHFKSLPWRVYQR